MPAQLPAERKMTCEIRSAIWKRNYAQQTAQKNHSRRRETFRKTRKLSRPLKNLLGQHFPNCLFAGAVVKNHCAENVLDDQPGVVYFVQLSGAKCT